MSNDDKYRNKQKQKVPSDALLVFPKHKLFRRRIYKQDLKKFTNTFS
jgi:hypothetical protein